MIDKFFRLYDSSSVMATMREKGVELLNGEVLRKLREVWGVENKIYTCKLQVYMVVGKLPLWSHFGVLIVCSLIKQLGFQY